jgi:hypothetical protein
MADTKISNLPELLFVNVSLADVLPIVNSGTTQKIALSTLFQASSSSYIPYINTFIAPTIALVNANFPLWNGAYTTVQSLSSFWTTRSVGTDNITVGQNNFANLTTGYKNIAIGTNALSSVTSGSGNVAIGYQALGSNSTGNGNTAIGYNAGFYNTVGTNNTYIGNQSAPNCCDESNTINLGNAAIKTLRCQAGSITSLSDKRDKTNISLLSPALAFINALEPVSFDWNSRDGSKVGCSDIGFIAQQLVEAQQKTDFVVPGLVDESNPDKIEASYGKLIPILVKAIQDLTEEINNLKNNS